MTPATFTTERKAHGSQRAVAKRMGIGFRTLQRLEKGAHDPIPAKYITLLRSLEL